MWAGHTLSKFSATLRIQNEPKQRWAGQPGWAVCWEDWERQAHWDPGCVLPRLRDGPLHPPSLLDLWLAPRTPPSSSGPLLQTPRVSASPRAVTTWHLQAERARLRSGALLTPGCPVGPPLSWSLPHSPWTAAPGACTLNLHHLPLTFSPSFWMRKQRVTEFLESKPEGMGWGLARKSQGSGGSHRVS